MPSIYDSLSQDSVVANSLWVMMQKEQTIYRSCNYFDQPSLVTESDRKKMVHWCYSVIDNRQLDRDNVAMVSLTENCKRLVEVLFTHSLITLFFHRATGNANG